MNVVMEIPAGEGVCHQGETTFQIAEVTRPLMSVSKLCMRGGYDVLCRKDKAFILDSEHKVVALFSLEEGGGEAGGGGGVNGDEEAALIGEVRGSGSGSG